MSETGQVDLNMIPRHVAIIMDGNGRWAKQRGKERSYGHQVGVETAREVAETAAKLGVKYLTLYTFSMENWNRPVEEISALMTLLLDAIEEEIFMKNNISFRVIGDISRLPSHIQDRLFACIERVSANTGMCLVLALSYSSRWEITDTAKRIAEEVKNGTIALDDINSDMFGKHLATNFMPDPDLLIRTGGEIRLSNYLLWQCAYSELYFCDTYWPDFKEDAFLEAIRDYQRRERRFGKTSEQVC